MLIGLLHCVYRDLGLTPALHRRIVQEYAKKLRQNPDKSSKSSIRPLVEVPNRIYENRKIISCHEMNL